jgi:hypothetical protein
LSARSTTQTARKPAPGRRPDLDVANWVEARRRRQIICAPRPPVRSDEGVADLVAETLDQRIQQVGPAPQAFGAQRVRDVPREVGQNDPQAAISVETSSSA